MFKLKVIHVKKRNQVSSWTKCSLMWREVPISINCLFLGQPVLNYAWRLPYLEASEARQYFTAIAAKAQKELVPRKSNLTDWVIGGHYMRINLPSEYHEHHNVLKHWRRKAFTPGFYLDKFTLMTTVTVAMDTDSRAIPKSLSNLFAAPRPEYCQRCSDKVYYVEKVGPVNGVIFHKQCFKCATCSQHLTMKTYFTNQVDIKDKEIYCGTHTPRGATVGLDAQAMGIRGALMAQKGAGRYNEHMKGQAPMITGQALYISHPLAAQKGLGYKYKQQFQKHHFPAYVVSINNIKRSKRK